MIVDFATTLHIQDRSSGAPASLVDVAELVGAWADVPDPTGFIDPVQLTEVGKRRASIRTEKLDLGAGNAWAWTMRLTHRDTRDEKVRWVVEVQAVEDPDFDTTTVAISVGRESIDRQVRVLRTDPPAPPSIIRRLAESRTFDCLDGPIPLAAEESELVREGVEGFVSSTLLEPQRNLPIVGITLKPSSGTAIVSPRRIARRLAGMAHIWVIPPESTWALSTHLPDGLGVYNGAVRLWWPGLYAGADRFDHQLWLPRDGDAEVEDEIVSLIAQSARAHFRPPGAIQQIRARLREEEHARLLDRIDALQRRRAEQTESGSAADQADLEVLRFEIEDLQRDREDLIAYAESAEQGQLDAEEKLAQSQARNRELHYDNEELKRRLRLATGKTDTAGMSKPEASFIDEIESEWMNRLTVDDRKEWPLREIRIHPNFLLSLDDLLQGGGIARDKVIQVCAEVACDRAREIEGRQVHPLRTDRGAESPQRVRATDGAKAYRCALQRETPQARRLHWWRIPGVDAIEFAHAGLHDDESCPA